MAPRAGDRRDEYVRATERVLDKILTCTQMNLPYGIDSSLEWQYLNEIHDLQVELIEVQEKAAKQFGKAREAPKTKAPLADRLSKFKKWLHNNGVSKETPVDFKADLPEGVGAVATRNIKAGEELIVIPRSLMLTTLSAQRSPRIREFLQADRNITGQLPMAALLALHLLEHKFDPTSFYKPYLDVLPEAIPLPIFFDPSGEELEVLKGTSAVREVASALREVLRGYALAYRSVERSKVLSIWQFTYNEWRWASAVMLTRQNMIPGYSRTEAAAIKAELGVDEDQLPQRVMALIPGWDFINCKEGLKITSTNDFDEGAQVCKAAESYKAGQQVYIGYTEGRPNRSRLARSGFLTPHATTADTLHISFAFPKLKDVTRRRDLAASRFTLREPFPLDIAVPLRSNFDNVIGTLAIAFATPADLEFLDSLPAIPTGEGVAREDMHATYVGNAAKCAERYAAGELECAPKIFRYIETQCALYLGRTEDKSATAAKTVAALEGATDLGSQVRRNANKFVLLEREAVQNIVAHVKELRESGKF